MSWMIALLGLGCVGQEVDLRVVSHDLEGGAVELWVQDGKLIEKPGPFARARQTVWGDLVTAGFIDAHAHPEGLTALVSGLDLSGATSLATTLDRVKLLAPEPGAWVTGRGWDQNDWEDNPNGDFPTAAQLDAVVPDAPVVLKRIDGHALWANSAALREAHIDATTPDPPGGRILRDATGAPSGVLIDAAMALMPEAPRPTELYQKQLREAQSQILKGGLVGVHVMGVDDDTLAALKALDERGELKVRMWVYLGAESAAAKAFPATGPLRYDRLEVVGVKAYADGALGSRGAHLGADYSDDPGNRGLSLADAASLRALGEPVVRAGGSFAVHAIGDEAVHEALDAYEVLAPLAKMPLRVEHAQVVRPDDVPRFQRLGVVASMQPTHATSDAPWAEARLGPERVRWAYAWRTMLRAGVILAFGSDFPVERVPAEHGIWSATTRLLTEDGGGTPWYPDEALSLAETIEAFTAGTYRALGREAPRLEPGQPADLTLWSREQRGAQPRLRCTSTIVNGEVLWVLAGS